MKEKIFTALKTKYKNMGLSDEILEGVAIQLEATVTTEDGIATAVAGVENQLKAIQSYADGRVNKLKTDNEALREQIKGLGSNTPPGAGSGNQESEDIPAWAKSLTESLNALTAKFQAIDGEKTHNTLQEDLIKALDEKKVPKSYYLPSLTNRKFEKKEDTEALLTTISSSYEAFVQDTANGTPGVPPPAGSGAQNKDAQSIAKMINDGTKQITDSKN